MRYMFIVQGEGRGHLTQAMTLERLLLSAGHEVAGILVGKSPSRRLPDFFTKGVSSPLATFESLNFVPDKRNRRPNLLRTIAYETAISHRYFPSIDFIAKSLREASPDVVVNLYEVLGTLGYRKSRLKSPEVCIAHQYIFLHGDVRLPIVGYEESVGLNFFSRMTAFGARKVLALSFRQMPPDSRHRIHVVPPLLRKSVLDVTQPTDGGYVLGYLLNAGFAEDVRNWHSAHPQVPLRFFWDKADAPAVTKVDDGLSFYALDDGEFIRQMSGCRAYASTAGFESICEAMYMGKPLLMVPAHIEQKCNAWDATRSGAAVASEDFDLDVLLDFAQGSFRRDEAFPEWARSASSVFLRELTEL